MKETTILIIFSSSPCHHCICRYDVAVDNIFDIAHVPYAHKGLLPYFRDEEDPGRYVPDLNT